MEKERVAASHRDRVRASLLAAGMHPAYVARGSRIDLVAYHVSTKGMFVACPVTVRAPEASTLTLYFGARIKNMIYAFVVGPERIVYAANDVELRHVCLAMDRPALTRARRITLPWNDKLRGLLEPYRVTRASWARFFEREVGRRRPQLELFR
ncbi:MAG: hypothetical protein ACAI38_15200 [Myxococcota bacterium]|nr:hypothetical protein [Myxococcota bacterium]